MRKLKKYANMLKLAASYYISKLAKRDLVWGMPYSLGVELTNHCNLSCPCCASGSGTNNRERGYISQDLFRKIVDELSAYTISTMFYFQGESMLHPAFFDMLRQASTMGVIISTNGHYLDENNCKLLAGSRFRKIIVSLDGITEETYTKYRVNGDLSKVLDGILLLNAELSKSRSNNKLELQVLVNRYNEGELESIKEYGRSLGLKVSFKSMQITGVKDSGSFLPLESRYSRYLIREGSLEIRSSLANHCYRLWTNPVITWDGKVLPCCFDKDAQYIMGDISKQSLKEIWKGPEYSTFRKRLIQNRAGIDICNNCSEGLYRKIKV